MSINEVINGTQTTSGNETTSVISADIGAMSGPPRSCCLSVKFFLKGYCAAQNSSCMIEHTRRLTLDDSGAIVEEGAIQSPLFNDVPPALAGVAGAIATVVADPQVPHGALIVCEAQGRTGRDIVWTGKVEISSTDFTVPPACKPRPVPLLFFLR
jgi:hypothetical protein